MLARHPASDAMVAWVAPAILAVLGDGESRSMRTVVAALADRYSKDEVVWTLLRLAVTDWVAEVGGEYSPPTSDGAG